MKSIIRGPKPCSTEQFVRKAQAKHGGKYDYSQVIYRHSKEKVIIICPIHGIFEQLPVNYIFSNWCPKCIHSVTPCEFIAKAQKVHGERYDYTDCHYKKNSLIVSICCPQHGPFNQSPANHLRGSGCPSCANVFRGDTEHFILRARQQHGEKYDYSQVKYADTKKRFLSFARSMARLNSRQHLI